MLHIVNKNYQYVKNKIINGDDITFKLGYFDTTEINRK